MQELGRNAGCTMTNLRAIIDIGSNTVRMVVYGGPDRVPVVLLNEKVTAKLGKGVAENGQLSAKSMALALASLRRFATLLQMKRVADWQCVATAAVRDATNGAEFLEQVAALGLEPRLLSGEEEAIASARGVMAAFPGAKGVVGDLGGGSLELVDIDGESCSHGTSMPLGTLRLTELRAAGGVSFSRNVHKILAGADWAGDHGLPLYIVGGSWRALARYAMYKQKWPLDDPHGFEITPEQALSLARSVGHGMAEQDIPGLSKSRVGSIPDAAALLGVIVREIRPSHLIFSSWGLREGLLNARLGRDVQAQDPMLTGVTAFCEREGIAAATGVMVAEWTAPAIPLEGPGSEHLRLAATLLALASMGVEPNMRAEQALDWAMRKRWIGLDACGRAVLAMAALANVGQTAIPDDLARLASPEELHQAIAWGLAIRLCRKFSANSANALSNSALSREGGHLVLTVCKPFDALLTNSIERALTKLTGWLDLEPKIRCIPANAKLDRLVVAL